MKRLCWHLCVFALLFLITGCAVGPRGFPATESIANFDEVDAHLYRGAQPNRVGLQYLRRLGVKTIVDLRAPNDAWPEEKQAATAEGMAYYNVPMSCFLPPKAATVTTALALIDKSPAPVFVHCQYGCDRTGMVIACYRIRHDGWRSSQALREARMYGMYPWELGMKSFVSNFKEHSEARMR